MSFLQYFNWSYWLIPSYAPAYGQLGNYEIWGQSILMYFFLFCTAITLAIVTLMDSDSPNISSASFGPMMDIPSELGPGLGAASELGPPVAPAVGGKKMKHKNKSKSKRR